MAIGTLIFGVSAAEMSAPARQKRAKARYYYLQSVSRDLTDTLSDAVFELQKRAYRSDPTYPEAASAYGMSRLQLDYELDPEEEEVIKEESLAMMRSLVNAYPQDYLITSYYAYVLKLLYEMEEEQRVREMIDRYHPERTENLLELARLALHSFNPTRCLFYLEEYEEREGPEPELVQKKIDVLLAVDDTIGARDEVERQIAAHPGDIEYASLRGDLAMRLEQPDSALYYYQQQAALDTTAIEPLLNMWMAVEALGDSIAYSDLTYKILLHDDVEVTTKVGILSTYLQSIIDANGSTTRGDHLFDVLNNQYPHDPEVRNLSARYSAAKGDLDHAIEELQYALDQDGSNLDYWGQLISYQIYGNKYKEGIESYTRAVEKVGDLPQLKRLYAVLLTESKEYHKAIDTYKEIFAAVAPDINPMDSLDTDKAELYGFEELVELMSTYMSLGNIYHELNENDSTFLCYDNAMKIYDQDPELLNNYAYFLALADKDLDKALEMSEKAVTKVPDNPAYLDTYAWILFLKEDYEKALEFMETSLKESVNWENITPDYYSHYGDILFFNGKTEEAVKAWQQALDDPDPNESLSEADRQLLRRKVAKKAYLKE